MLQSTPELLDEEVVPYPAAVRFLGSLGLIEDERAFELAARLAATPGYEARQQASLTVASLARRSDSPWLLAFAIQFSHDEDVEVRAHAGRALARLARVSQRDTSAALCNQRLGALLMEDGLLVPTMIIRGLSDVGGPISGEVAEHLGRLEQRHPSRVVRKQAALLLRDTSPAV